MIGVSGRRKTAHVSRRWPAPREEERVGALPGWYSHNGPQGGVERTVASVTTHPGRRKGGRDLVRGSGGIREEERCRRAFVSVPQGGGGETEFFKPCKAATSGRRRDVAALLQEASMGGERHPALSDCAPGRRKEHVGN